VKRFLLNNVSLLSADILILFICISGVYLITLKADLPFKTSTVNSKLIVFENPASDKNIKAGDEIISIDNLQFDNWEEIELYLDGKNIGDKVEIQLSSNGESKSVTVQLINYYRLDELIIISFVALVFIVMGVFVRIRASENHSAHLFHWASLGLGVVIVLTAGYYNIEPLGYGHFNRIVWLLAYSLTPVLFIHFTSSFSKKKVKGINYILRYFYISAFISAFILSYFFLNATIGKDSSYIKYYVLFFDSIFRIFLIVCIVIAISICIYAYRVAGEIEERKRLQWLLMGFFIGPFSFVILWVIPIFLTGRSLIPESLILIFLVAIPITFSIAIIKYHLMDINLIIRRSVVYTIILSAIIITYVGLSSIITLFVKDINPAFPSVLTAIAVVVLLQPVKNGIQKFVDKKFFRVEYDYREEQKRFLEDIENSLNIQTLAEKLVKQTDSLIPVHKIGLFILHQPDNRIKLIANKGWDLLKGRSVRFEAENLKTDLSVPIAVDDKVEPGLDIESADVKVFKRWGMVLVFPVKSPTGIIHAFLALGVKKSGSRFLKDDVDLLNTVVAVAALTIDRIKLQEELILEHLEAERLEELNELKSFFLQTITHELKTPLTSIKMFTEKLQDKKDIASEKSDFYLQVIDGESDKLRRLIDNILDYARIEKGMKTYNQKCIDLNQVVKKTIDSIKYQLIISRQSVEVTTSSDEIIINADDEAVERAITNLLTNAIKYSSPGSKTSVSVEKINGSARIEVKDEGKGISTEDLKNIFEPFRRAKSVETKNIEGTGLGLAIVKHIMDAHKGRIEVQSEPGKGSTFSLFFSVEE
jgi:two-component system phosphate regulon sensor histidine kinase PhoR